jgi:hypothetical protein
MHLPLRRRCPVPNKTPATCDPRHAGGERDPVFVSHGSAAQARRIANFKATAQKIMNYRRAAALEAPRHAAEEASGVSQART